MATEVRRNDEGGRYEITVDGDLAGFTQFHPDGDVLVFPHTQIDERYSGSEVDRCHHDLLRDCVPTGLRLSQSIEQPILLRCASHRGARIDLFAAGDDDVVTRRRK